MTDTVAPAPLSTAPLRRLFGTLHLWVGVVIGIPAALLGATGIALMLTHPLPAVVSTDSYAAVASIDAVIAAARTAAPEDATPQQFDAAPAGKPVTMRFGVPRTDENPRGFLRVQIDPASLVVMPGETQSPMSVERLVHDLHGSFLMGRDGRPVVGWIGVFMCGLACSGIVLWWPARGKWRAAFKVSGRGNTLMVLREIHGAAGIWGLIVFFIISFTGVLIAFPPGGAGGRDAGGQDGGRRAHHDKAPLELHADLAAAQALANQPGYVLRSVAFPRGADDTYKVTLMKVGIDRSVPPVIVTVDSAAAKVESVRNTAEDARAWARPVHTGGSMGRVWWILTLLSGALPVIFATSGIWMWLIKSRNRARIAANP